MNKTSIGWCDYTSNPIYPFVPSKGYISGRGWFCTKVSPGCANCYAEALNKRLGNRLEFQKRNEDKVRFHIDTEELQRIIKHRKPGKVFLCDMTDLFHEQIPIAQIHSVLRTIRLKPSHTFQVLTKRPERMRMVCASLFETAWKHIPLPNLWLGVSVENQQYHDERVPILQDTPAAVRFLSCEPLLGPIKLDLRGIDWVIVGGESGPRFRPMEIKWLDDIVEQCEKAGVAVWVKQDSGRRPGMAGRIDNNTWFNCKQFPLSK